MDAADRRREGVAGVAPIGVVVALLTLSIALGNGAGVPGTYLIAGVVLALFAVGYVRMSRRIANVGGFYTYYSQVKTERAVASSGVETSRVALEPVSYTHLTLPTKA